MPNSGNRRRSWMSLGSIFCLILFLNQTAAARTYNIEVYDGFFDAGWTMEGGTITTNGFVGTINQETDIASVFTDWSIPITSPQGQFEFTPANSEFSVFGYDTHPTLPVVSVDEEEINVFFRPFHFVLNTNSGESIDWIGAELIGSYTIVSSVEIHYGGSSSRVSFWRCEVSDLPENCPDFLLVASVPEPESRMLVGAVFLGVAWCRRQALYG